MATALLGGRQTMMVSTTPILIQPSSAKSSGKARRSVGRNSMRRVRGETGCTPRLIAEYDYKFSASLLLRSSIVSSYFLVRLLRVQRRSHAGFGGCGISSPRSAGPPSLRSESFPPRKAWNLWHRIRRRSPPSVPGHDAVPLGPLLPLAVSVFELFVGSEAE